MISMSTARKWISYLAAATTLSIVSLSSSAQPAAEASGRSLPVKVWDLDLADSADVQQLYERLQNAANEVCEDEVREHRRETRARPPVGWTESCVKRAVDEAVREAGNRRLAALHQDTSRG
jgi:UrcA family protein